MSEQSVRSRLRDALNEPSDDDIVGPRARRRIPEMLLGLLLVTSGALGGVLVFQRSNDRTVVVGSARDLQRGTLLTRSDVIAVEVGALPAGAATQAGNAGVLLGQRLLVDLPAGVPISPQVVTPDELLGPSEALIPVALDPGAVPSGLGRGDAVRVVISFPNQGPDAPAPQVLGDVIEVFDIVTPDDFGDSIQVTLRANSDIAVDLARAERVQLLKVADQ
jgi:hypothetical protein